MGMSGKLMGKLLLLLKGQSGNLVSPGQRGWHLCSHNHNPAVPGLTQPAPAVTVHSHTCPPRPHAAVASESQASPAQMRFPSCCGLNHQPPGQLLPLLSKGNCQLGYNAFLNPGQGQAEKDGPPKWSAQNQDHVQGTSP